VWNSLWCTEQGELYTQPSAISREVKTVLVKAGIDRHFPAYSARHALITFLLRLGFSEVEVGFYTISIQKENGRGGG
jgi:site-specific recombinase XerD